MCKMTEYNEVCLVILDVEHFNQKQDWKLVVCHFFYWDGGEKIFVFRIPVVYQILYAGIVYRIHVHFYIVHQAIIYIIEDLSQGARVEICL